MTMQMISRFSENDIATCNHIADLNESYSERTAGTCTAKPLK